jgi:tetratricopeptide (TPR) repeat protein
VLKQKKPAGGKTGKSGGGTARAGKNGGASHGAGNPDGAKHSGAGKTRGAAARKKLRQAIQAGRERNYKKAVLILEELLSGFEAPPEAYLFLGRSLHALGDYSRAIASFNDYVRLEPDSPQGYFFTGRAYLALGMPHRAVPLLRKARSLDPENITVQALLGTAYLKSRHSQLAADTFAAVVEKAAEKGLPQGEQTRFYHAYINALLVRGINLCRIDDYELGGQMLRFVLENARDETGVYDNPLLRLELGRACRETGDLSEALEHYTEALKYNPGDVKIRWYRASLLMALGENQEALKEIEFIRSVGAGLPDLPWNSRAVDFYMIRAFMDAGEWRRAADSCRLALKQYGQDPLIHALYAEAFRNLGDFGAALNHLERAVELDPGNLNLWYERILVAWEGENWKALGSALRSASRLDGDKNIISRFSILLETKTGEDDRAVIALLQDAIRGLGPDPELMYALGERYLKTGLVDLALSWFRKTTSVQENHEKSRLGEIAALEALSLEGETAAGDSAGQGRAGNKKTRGLLKKTERQAAARVSGKISGELRAAYDAYVSRWPDNFILRRERALYLIRTFEYEEAAGEFETLLAWEPSNPSLRRVLAYAYRKTGRYREASIFLKSLLKEKPRSIEILLEYTGCLERAGAARYAAAVLEKAKIFLPKAPEIPMALGLLYAKDKNPEKAFDLLREAAAIDKHDPRPYRLMAALAAKKGDREGQKKYEYEAGRREKSRVS